MSFSLQEQYIFVHDLLCDYVSSGDTSVSIHVVSASVDKLSKPVTEDGPTGFEEQFNVRLDDKPFDPHACLYVRVVRDMDDIVHIFH